MCKTTIYALKNNRRRQWGLDPRRLPAVAVMPARLRLAHHVETQLWAPSSLCARLAQVGFFGFAKNVDTSNRRARLNANRTLARYLGYSAVHFVSEDSFRAHIRKKTLVV